MIGHATGIPFMGEAGIMAGRAGCDRLAASIGIARGFSAAQRAISGVPTIAAPSNPMPKLGIVPLPTIDPMTRYLNDQQRKLLGL
jgi:hypothetical protein